MRTLGCAGARHPIERIRPNDAATEINPNLRNRLTAPGAAGNHRCLNHLGRLGHRMGDKSVDVIRKEWHLWGTIPEVEKSAMRT